jgi:leucyl aminopeptidase (aminopeptidase T)
MISRLLFSCLIVCGLAVSLAAQAGSNPCATIAKKHLGTLDKHLDLNYNQMKCLKEKAVQFCTANSSNPASSKAQQKKRLAAFQKALLECLNPGQQNKVKTHFRNKRDEKERRSILQAFLEEFGDEVIVIKKRN